MRLIVPSSAGVANTVVNIAPRSTPASEARETYSFGKPLSEQKLETQRNLISEKAAARADIEDVASQPLP